jgi:hypothetical protein
MTAPIEAGVGDIWLSPQATLGTRPTVPTTGTIHLRHADGGLKAAKTIGAEEWTDGRAFGSASQYIDAIGGAVGTVTFQGQIETAGSVFAFVCGVDVVTGTTPNFTHTISVTNANGKLLTVWQRVGVNVGPQSEAYVDSQISKLTWTCGQDQKVNHMALDVLSLTPSQFFTTAPTVVDSGTDPFLWQEVTGAITIDAFPYGEIDCETLEIDRKLDVHRGDKVSPIVFVPGKGEINRSFSALVTDNTLAVYRNALYGTVTMSDGLNLAQTVTYVALSSTYTRNANRSLQITTPKVAVKPDDFEVFPNAQGGKIPIAFGGQVLYNGTTQMQVVAKTGDATAYV